MAKQAVKITKYNEKDGKVTSWVADYPAEGITAAELTILFSLGVFQINMLHSASGAEDEKKLRLLIRNSGKPAVEAYLNK